MSHEINNEIMQKFMDILNEYNIEEHDAGSIACGLLLNVASLSKMGDSTCASPDHLITIKPQDAEGFARYQEKQELRKSIKGLADANNELVEPTEDMEGVPAGTTKH